MDTFLDHTGHGNLVSGHCFQQNLYLLLNIVTLNVEKSQQLYFVKKGLKHPRAVYDFLMENRRLGMNPKHPFVYSEDIKSFEKHNDFFEYLIGLEYIKNDYLPDLYNSLVKKIETLYGKDKSLSILSLEEAISVYLLVLHIKPEIVVETGLSDGMSSFFILSAMNENQKGNLYSIDLLEIEMLRLYGKESGWIVNDTLRKRWMPIYWKDK